MENMVNEIYLDGIEVSSYREQYHIGIDGKIRIVRWVVSDILILDEELEE